MGMAKISKPEIVFLFENLLWANSPKHWVLKSTYFQKTLFVSMLIETSVEGQYQKIRRSFSIKVIYDRKEDLYGLAKDCVDEMKTGIKD